MTHFIMCQLSFLLFAVASAVEEFHYTYPFRNVTWDPKQKKISSQGAHSFGGIGVTIVLIMCGVSVGFFTTPMEIDLETRIIVAFLAAVSSGLIYWLAFDIVYAVLIKQDPFYLGETAGTDKWLVSWLGANAGVKKAVGCTVLIITINLVFKFFI